ncbi:MAG: HipA domain-containing protein [Thiofilum sp.]|uniref:type II toxin-antitoxin system HipA family toxin n=1 Tax=Thiofilum sp. TaxID=2212733 RepID=UPI0025D78CB5|nr:HipA domain-containing protein [Thiofilum sp.]MBK8452672.1 HipA domain-containing protein [Thiofilum sp.]
MKCTIEIFHNNQWHEAATFMPAPDVTTKGYKSAGRLSYDTLYAAQYSEQGISAAVSCRYPVNFEIHKEEAWAAFLLDILPSGAGRRFWLQKLGIRDGASADWSLLCQGAGNPIGNLRIREAVKILDSNTPHLGFSYDEVLSRGDAFIEYAYQHGAPIAGSSGAQGDAPKFLLTQDKNQRWHGDGTLPDDQCSKYWLVKFPRSNRLDDVRVLRNEAAYYAVAQWFGVRTGQALELAQDALFIPRFDRVVKGDQVQRLGVESLTSLAGISDFGMATSQNKYCHVIAQYTTQPETELLEFVRRDVLNVALGNTDNHGRNTAVIRYPDNQVWLSPLYDFAPMILDSQGIARVSRWENEEHYGQPEWVLVAKFLIQLGCNPTKVYALFNDVTQKLLILPQILDKFGVDKALQQQLQPRIQTVLQHLQAVKP